MKKIFFTHTFLIALYPVIDLLSANIGGTPLSIILVPAVVVMGLTILLLFLAVRILKDRFMAGIVVSFFLIFVFSYFSRIFLFSIEDPAHRYLISAYILFFICIAYLIIRIRTSLVVFTKILNVVAILLFLLPLANITVYKLRALSISLDITNTKKIKTILTNPNKAKVSPDIYYIILDRYANESTLKEIYNFDNSEFIGYLFDKGFYVASQSRSNYINTGHSLSSSLNLRYINNLCKKIEGPTDNWLPIYKMLEDYKVWRFLKPKGYQFVHVGSWWYPTYKNKFADININLYWPPDFINVLYRGTIFYPILKELGYPHNFIQWKRINYQFDEIAKIPNIKEPTFVFAHMLIPHPPFVFDRYGNFLPEEKVNKRSNEENYVEQLIYTNQKVKMLVEQLILKSKIPPIILLQADEGPFPNRYRLNRRNFNWEKASKAELRQKTGILNAYYLPNADKDIFYPSITPVNSFRVIFNHYFNLNYELLPDKSYAIVDSRHLYSFFDVTDLVKLPDYNGVSFP
jgi:hypothetical protein